MDDMLSDELLQEIFRRLPPPSSSAGAAAESLVSKRWLRLYRAATTSLSLRFPSQDSFSTSPIAALLSHYPFLSSVTVISAVSSETSDKIGTVISPDSSAASDRLLVALSSSSIFNSLRNFRFFHGPVSVYSLLSFSASCAYLTSLSISLSRPLSLRWLVSLQSLKHLSLFLCSNRIDASTDVQEFDFKEDHLSWLFDKIDAYLPIESLYLTGLRADDQALGWLWRNCKKLRRLRLRSCEGIGDNKVSFSSFINCLLGLRELELMACRGISNGVLLKLSENNSLSSLLIYDGASKDGLLQFIHTSRCNLRRLDLRLPLDLDNDHLFAVARSFRGLSSLLLQSCCLVTGEGLKTIAQAITSGLEELTLINCDVVDREPGLLATLGQNLRQLRTLDLSRNDMLLDKDLISMLVSCNHLVHLNLRGCSLLTNATMFYMLKSCRHLECVDIVHCCGIEAEAVEAFVMNSPRLRRLLVEASMLSDAVMTLTSHKLVVVD